VNESGMIGTQIGKHSRSETVALCSNPTRIKDVYFVRLSLLHMYEGRPEGKDRLAIKKNKQIKNKKNNVSLLQTLSYFSTQSSPTSRHLS
jgi:hypothetical protein